MTRSSCWYVLSLLCRVANVLHRLTISYIKAYNHVNEKQSSLGANAVDVIAKHLQCLEYGPADVKVWCRWAKQVDGPIFYEKPTPQSCTFNNKDEDYIIRGSVTSCFAVCDLIFLRNPKGICAHHSSSS
jgi:hypothetical protein